MPPSLLKIAIFFLFFIFIYLFSEFREGASPEDLHLMPLPYFLKTVYVMPETSGEKYMSNGVYYKGWIDNVAKYRIDGAKKKHYYYSKTFNFTEQQYHLFKYLKSKIIKPKHVGYDGVERLKEINFSTWGKNEDLLSLAEYKTFINSMSKEQRFQYEKIIFYFTIDNYFSFYNTHKPLNKLKVYIEKQIQKIVDNNYHFNQKKRAEIYENIRKKVWDNTPPPSKEQLERWSVK